jgi:Ca2+-binding RTX toxin-like protein
MAIDPAVLQVAYVATSDPAGALGGIPAQLGVPVYVAVFFEAGRSYNVSTNVAPGDLVLLGPNGNPINPGVAIRSFTFTPQTSGIYFVNFVPNPRFVANGQPISVTVTEQELGLPSDIQSALSLDLALNAVSTALGIAGGGRQQQFFLHPPGSPLPTDADDVVAGGAGQNILFTHGGNDRLFGGGENDVLRAGTGDDLINGGDGLDAAIFSGDFGQYQFGRAGNTLFMAGPDGLDALVGVEVVQIGGAAPVAANILLNASFTIIMAFGWTNTQTGQSSLLAAAPYDGPVAHLTLQFLGSASGEAVSGTAFNDFVNALGGDDAVDAGLGDDVIDGGTGSNFLTGGTGQEVFFLDGRGGAVTWATITDWQGGEQLSVWGWRPGVSRAIWVEGDGAAGFRGVTMHGDLNGDGTIDTSVTWTGMARGQLPTPLELDGLLWFR